MSKKKSLIFTFIITFASIYISKILWPTINFPFDDKINIIGPYYLQKYNPINDILRYLIFISLPLLVFFISVQFFFYSNLRKIKDVIFADNSTQTFEIKNNYGLLSFLIFTIIIAVLGFTSVNFPLGKIDLFHEGNRLTPVTNYLLDKGLWSSSFMIQGLFNQVLQTLIGFNLFDVQSIGSSRVMSMLLTLLTKLSVIFLIYQISKELNYVQRFTSFYFS